MWCKYTISVASAAKCCAFYSLAAIHTHTRKADIISWCCWRTDGSHGCLVRSFASVLVLVLSWFVRCRVVVVAVAVEGRFHAVLPRRQCAAAAAAERFEPQPPTPEVSTHLIVQLC